MQGNGNRQKQSWKSRTKLEGSQHPNYEAHYKAMVVKTVWFWLYTECNRQNRWNRQNRIESPEMNPHI